MLCEAKPQGLWQCRCVQSQIGAAGAEGPSAKHIPALCLLLFGQLFEHLTQVRQTKINLAKQEIEGRKKKTTKNVHLKHDFFNAAAFSF